METIFARLTVYFEDPFWIGVYEREEDGALTACRIVFGAEPRDGEVYALLLQDWAHLRLGPPVEAAPQRAACRSPKRRQRVLRHALTQKPGATRAREALKASCQQAATARETRRRAQTQAEQERKFQLRQQKKKQKHRGK